MKKQSLFSTGQLSLYKASPILITNRDLSKIKLGQSEESLQDTNHSFVIEANNSYCYRNLCMYHFDKCAYSETLRLFVKAQELYNSTPMIEELINDAKHRIEQKSAGSDIRTS